MGLGCVHGQVDQGKKVGSFEDWKLHYGHLQEKPAAAPKQIGDSTSRRKHQITWLAAEAKELNREREQHWSNASQKRREAKARYGF